MEWKMLYSVFESTDYDNFKRMSGNRSVDALRLKKVRNSFEKNGQRKSVAIVTDGNMVVDGQARFEVCKENGLPFLFAYIPGMTVDDCQVLNSTSTNWSVFDLIKSKAEDGDEDFQWVVNLVAKYEKKTIFPRSLIYIAANKHGKSVTVDRIQQGRFELDDKDFVINLLDTYQSISEAICSIGGGKSCWMLGLKECIRQGLDVERIVRQLNTNKANDRLVFPPSTTAMAITSFLNVYNHGLPKKNRISFYYD